jgi:hypothetical protein
MGSLFREITILISQQFRENSGNEISLEPYMGRTSTGAEANTKETISTFNVKPINKNAYSLQLSFLKTAESQSSTQNIKQTFM